jgi:hypothetical protein
MSGHGEKLSRRQDLAIASLLTCPTVLEAATLSGVAEITLYRWLKLEDFQAAYREARRAVVAQAIHSMQQACGEAVETLRTIMTDAGAPASARVSASKAVLEIVARAEEIEQLDARIRAMEARIATKESQ